MIATIDRGRPTTSGHRPSGTRRVALYARVSTHDQTADNQLLALRAYAEARGWQAVEYVDHGISGARSGGRLSTRFWRPSEPARWTWWRA